MQIGDPHPTDARHATKLSSLCIIGPAVPVLGHGHMVEAHGLVAIEKSVRILFQIPEAGPRSGVGHAQIGASHAYGRVQWTRLGKATCFEDD